MPAKHDFEETIRRLSAQVLGHDLSDGDGLAESVIGAEESRLGLRFPEALRTFLLLAGNCEQLCRTDNPFRRVSDYELDADFLVFLDENQFVVSWGYKLSELERANPIVWQRNNTEPRAWYSEEKDLLEFLEAMYEHLGILGGAGQQPG